MEKSMLHDYINLDIIVSGIRDILDGCTITIRQGVFQQGCRWSFHSCSVAVLCSLGQLKPKELILHGLT